MSRNYGGRVTVRALKKDFSLENSPEDLSLDELAGKDERIATFAERRAEMGAEGQEPINSLLPEVIAFSLHHGRWRMATWLHEAAATIWLIACGWHEKGSKNDAYAYFERLKKQQVLMPTKDDLAALVRAQDRALAESFMTEVPEVRERALASRDQIQTTRLGGRIAVRVVATSGNPTSLYVAISQRLFPGDFPLPKDWDVIVLGAFFPDTPKENLLSLLDDDFKGTPLNPEELAFSDMIE